ncbi:hypothetical protein [Halorubrum sp. CBA1125]|nr:hypothetical protein [Halorubrum sp. CBA1125]
MDATDAPNATDDRWWTLASVGIGYAVAAGVVFLLCFLLPFVLLRTL